MRAGATRVRWLRRARPTLGTLVEVGIGLPGLAHETGFDAAFHAIADVQACLSRFEPDSDIALFNRADAGTQLTVRRHTQRVLEAARQLHDASDGAFDITLRSAPRGWRCEGNVLHKLDDAARIDLGGIGKGYAVDCAIDALRAAGCTAGWVNAGGDLRLFGDGELEVVLRDETLGGVRPFGALRDGAFATSHFGRESRSCAAAVGPVKAHVSVAASRCLWADSLTKVVAITGNASHPLLERHGAQAWLHR